MAVRKRKALVAGEAKKIKSSHRKRYEEPHASARLFADQKTKHRHKNNIKRRDKPALARARFLHAVLLQIDAERKHRAAGDPGEKQFLFLRATILRARVQTA